MEGNIQFIFQLREEFLRFGKMHRGTVANILIPVLSGSIGPCLTTVIEVIVLTPFQQLYRLEWLMTRGVK